MVLWTRDVLYHRALMVTHQGCPQTPGGRIRALGFARMGARGRRRGPIPAMCQYQGSPVLRSMRLGIVLVLGLVLSQNYHGFLLYDHVDGHF